MITEKQVRDALGERWAKDAMDYAVDRLKAAGLIATETDKPLLMDAVAPMVVVHGEAMYLLSGSRLSAHQAALDEFAREVNEARRMISGLHTALRDKLDAALAAARKAGLTRVGAK